MVLIESCLSSLPNYTMGVYLLPEEVHHKIDTFRSNFFLARTEPEKKIPHGKLGSADATKTSRRDGFHKH
jgi:hypothetical protein